MKTHKPFEYNNNNNKDNNKYMEVTPYSKSVFGIIMCVFWNQNSKDFMWEMCFYLS